MPRKRRHPSHFVTCRHCGKKLGAVTVSHLRSVHGYEDEHPIFQYKAEFDLPFALCRDGRKRISEAKQTFWADRGQHWTPADVVADIQRIHRANGSLRTKLVPVRLQLAARRIFGGWDKAVEEAGFNYEEVSAKRRWNPAKVIERIQQLVAEGIPVSSTHVKEHYPFLHKAAIRLFPSSWTKALLAAGFDPKDHKMSRGKWDRQSAEAWVQERVREGKSILTHDVPRDLQGFVRGHLHLPWIDFVELLGIPYPGVKYRRDWTRDKLISEIRRWKKEGNRLNYGAVKLGYQSLIYQARRFFGSWDRARAAAGV